MRDSRGFDFTGYNRPSLERRITKRRESIGIDTIEAYLDHLQVDPDEFNELFDTILINVTQFFRDARVWSFVADEVIPKISERGGDAPIRIWVPGCASGEEAFTIAMLFADHIGEREFRQRVKIYATDVDEDALAQARVGTWAASALEPPPEGFAERLFETVASRATLRPEM